MNRPRVKVEGANKQFVFVEGVGLGMQAVSVGTVKVNKLFMIDFFSCWLHFKKMDTHTQKFFAVFLVAGMDQRNICG